MRIEDTFKDGKVTEETISLFLAMENAKIQKRENRPKRRREVNLELYFGGLVLLPVALELHYGFGNKISGLTMQKTYLKRDTKTGFLIETDINNYLRLAKYPGIERFRAIKIPEYNILLLRTNEYTTNGADNSIERFDLSLIHYRLSDGYTEDGKFLRRGDTKQVILPFVRDIGMTSLKLWLGNGGKPDDKNVVNRIQLQSLLGLCSIMFNCSPVFSQEYITERERAEKVRRIAQEKEDIEGFMPRNPIADFIVSVNVFSANFRPDKEFKSLYRQAKKSFGKDGLAKLVIYHNLVIAENATNDNTPDDSELVIGREIERIRRRRIIGYMQDKYPDIIAVYDNLYK